MRQSSTQLTPGTQRRRAINLRWAIFPAAFLVFAGILGVAVEGPAGSEFSSVGDFIFVGILAACAVLLIGMTGLMLAGVDGTVESTAAKLASSEDERRLLARWLSRARWARNIGGLSGILIWVFGTGGGGDLLLFGVGGIAIGAMLAELHRAAPSGAVRTASLQPRTLRDFLEREDLRRMAMVGAAAVVTSGVAIIAARDAPGALWGASAVLVLLLSLGVQQRIATRSRPALSDELRRADDFARRLAIGPGLARPSTYFALVLIAHAALTLQSSIGDWFALVAVAAWLWALALWWSNRGLRFRDS